MILLPALLALTPIQTTQTKAQQPAPVPWLVSHQEADGRWDADGFRSHDPDGSQRGTPGIEEADVAVTSLATLAFLGDGNTATVGPYRKTVASAVSWLAEQQDPESGWIGEQGHPRSLRYHALATVALSESDLFSPSAVGRTGCRHAVRLLSDRVLEDGGWSSDGTANMATDGLTTGWVFLALRSARDSGVEVDDALLSGAIAWFEAHADEQTGLVSNSSDGTTDWKATALGVLCRVMTLGPDDEKDPALVAAGDQLSRLQPLWSPDGAGMDPELWFLASLAAYRLGGEPWKRWNKTLKGLLVDKNRVIHDAVTPVDPELLAEGSVAGVACATLSVEIYFRYARIVGAR